MKPQPKAKRIIDKDYIKWIKSLPCCVCKKPGPSDPHHINKEGFSSMAGKSDDDRALPFCRFDHSEYHSQGRKTFAEKHRLDYETLISAYNTVWRIKNGETI